MLHESNEHGVCVGADDGSKMWASCTLTENGRTDVQNRAQTVHMGRGGHNVPQRAAAARPLASWASVAASFSSTATVSGSSSGRVARARVRAAAELGWPSGLLRASAMKSAAACAGGSVRERLPSRGGPRAGSTSRLDVMKAASRGSALVVAPAAGTGRALGTLAPKPRRIGERYNHRTSQKLPVSTCSRRLASPIKMGLALCYPEPRGRARGRVGVVGPPLLVLRGVPRRVAA
jgi:hypothetical protein